MLLRQLCGVCCVLVAICGVVPVRCAVGCCSVTVAVGCCCCGSGVVMGARSGAGDGCCSSSLPREVVGEVAAVTATTHPVANLDADVVVPLAAAVVASAARSCLEEAVEAKNVEDPEAKAKTGCCC